MLLQVIWGLAWNGPCEYGPRKSRASPECEANVRNLLQQQEMVIVPDTCMLPQHSTVFKSVHLLDSKATKMEK